MRFLFSLLALLFLTTFTAYRIYAGDVYINEFIIDRTPQAIELINTSTASADLSNWYLDDSGGTTYYTIPAGTVLYPQSCAVFEGDFNLNKSSADMVRLFSNAAPPIASNAVLIDSYSYRQSPGAGYSYARNPDAGPDWVTLPPNPGLFNQTGLSCITTPTPLPTEAPAPTEEITPTASVTAFLSPTATSLPDYKNIFISEVYPYPAAGEKEWVEIYNDNGSDAVLTDWYIDDIEDRGGTPRRFSATLPAHAYGVVEISGSLFNNDTDSVRLLKQDKTQIDGFEYGKPKQGKSLGRITFTTDMICLEEPSKGMANMSCLEVTPTAQPSTFPSIQPSAITLEKLPPPTRYAPVTQSTVLSQPVVLGETTIAPQTVYAVVEKPLPVRKLATVSFSYSILTIVSLLIKIKNGLTA